MAIEGRAKYTRARARNFERRDAKGAPKIRDYRQSQGIKLSEYIPSAKRLIGPFLDTCEQPGNSTQAAVNTRDNIDSDPFQFTEMADGLQA